MDANEIEQMLTFVPADLPREQWVRVGMAVKSELGEGGFSAFEGWSQSGGSFNYQDARDTWRSIKPGGGVTIATLVQMAKDGGYQPQKSARPDPAAAAEAKRQQQARNAAAEQQREADRRQVQAKAQQDWSNAKPASADHPYLQRKGIKPHHLRADAIGHLLVPLVDAATGEHWSNQRIAPDGSKRNRGKKRGCASFFGDFKKPEIILLAEGMATAASVHEATAWPTAAAIDAGNLRPVAKALRARFPNVPILVCGDNDRKTPGNPGAIAAREATERLSQAAYVLPQFPQGADSGLSDYNDLALLAGLAEIKRQITQAAEALLHADLLPQGFSINKDGLFYFPPDENGNGQPPIWVCSPLRVTAVTRSLGNEGWGRLLEFDDLDGQPHQWAMPLALLSGDGAEVRRILLDQGLRIAPGQRPRNLLNQFLQTAAPAARALSSEKTGWLGNCFILPDTVIGQSEQRILLQTGGTKITGYGCAGSLDGWRKQVAAHCAGNSRLILALAAAFAAPLLAVCDAEPGGFHFRGASSLGKSTTMLAAASVWGGHDRLKRWRSTDNALEATALEHNDSLLLLDELREADGKTLGQSIYMLAHGQGKVH
ncbi:MAG: DUF927 domain-containing protein, partial [Gammaproteobacteria bacterium SHHR-1]